jgi:hypothetical protein
VRVTQIVLVGLAAFGLACDDDGGRSERVRAGDPGALVVGVDGHYAEWPDWEVAERSALGAAVTRHQWYPSDQVDSQDDLVREAAADAKTRIHALLGGNDLGDPRAFADFVTSFIRRYGRGGSFWAENPDLDEERFAITTFELGNEPYLGEMSAAEYADAVLPALEAVDRSDLPARLVLPVGGIYLGEPGWLDTLYERIPALNELVYGFALHPYRVGEHPAASIHGASLQQIAQLRRALNQHGAADKPILITEYGQSTAACGGDCVSEDEQAEHLAALVDGVSARPDWMVELIAIFQLRDQRTDSSDKEEQFGLLRADGSAKPSYEIMRERMRRYR